MQPCTQAVSIAQICTGQVLQEPVEELGQVSWQQPPNWFPCVAIVKNAWLQ